MQVHQCACMLICLTFAGQAGNVIILHFPESPSFLNKIVYVVKAISLVRWADVLLLQKVALKVAGVLLPEVAIYPDLLNSLLAPFSLYLRVSTLTVMCPRAGTRKVATL